MHTANILAEDDDAAPASDSHQHWSLQRQLASLQTYAPWAGRRVLTPYQGRPASDPAAMAGSFTSSSSSSRRRRETQSVVAELQSRVFWAKMWVVVFTYGFDACAALVFTLSLLGTVHLGVLQGFAVGGAVLGMVCYAAGLVLVPPTMAAHAKLAASREQKGEALNPTKHDDVLRQCKVGSTWSVMLYCLHGTKLPEPDPWPLGWQTPRRVLADKLRALLVRLSSKAVSCDFSILQEEEVLHVLSFICAFGTAVVAIIGVPFYTSIPVLIRGPLGFMTVLYCAYPFCLHCVVLRGIDDVKRGHYDSRLLSSAFPTEYMCSLPCVWAWQCWVDVAAKSQKAVSAQTHVTPPVTVAQVRLSLCSTTSRLLLDSWCLLEVYWLTEWLRIMLLVAAACIAVSWGLSAGTALQSVPDHMRAAMAVLSLAVTYIKSVRDEWKLLERGMQQFAYAGAIVEQLEKWLHVPIRRRQGLPEYVLRWWAVELSLQEMSPLELASPPAQQQLMVAQEMVRRANKAVMADNAKACFL